MTPTAFMPGAIEFHAAKVGDVRRHVSRARPRGLFGRGSNRKESYAARKPVHVTYTFTVLPDQSEGSS